MKGERTDAEIVSSGRLFLATSNLIPVNLFGVPDAHAAQKAARAAHRGQA